MQTLETTKRIREELAARGLAAKVVRDMIGMPTSTWYRRMRNPRGWTLGELDDVAEVLKVDRTRLSG